MGESRERVTVEIRDQVADVRLNRPDKLNALDPAMFDELIGAGQRLVADMTVRAVILSGEGRGFCAGLDMESFAAVAAGGGIGDITQRTYGPANLFQQAALVWRQFPVPVIAAIHGVAFGGGLQIALGADMRIVAPDARLSVMEIKWGIVPDMGGMLLMRRLMRADVIRQLTFTGRIVSGEEAQRIGLATAIHDDPLADALEAAREIATRSPDALRAAKRLLNEADDERAAEILMAESRAQRALLGSPNQIEAVRANLERRPPVFRDPDA
ncbi:MAG TPA: crotonase/enoyl-CoA hydratase family protein [Enterovirga sp.]